MTAQYPNSKMPANTISGRTGTNSTSSEVRKYTTAIRCNTPAKRSVEKSSTVESPNQYSLSRARIPGSKPRKINTTVRRAIRQ